MKKIGLSSLIFLVTPGLLSATYAGSIVSSFYAGTIHEEGTDYYPLGLTYGDGYVWIVYAHGWITKNNPETGSIISSIFAWPGESDLGWAEDNKYIYASNYSKVVWYDSTTGSLVGSFPKPPEALINICGMDFNDHAPTAPIWTGSYGMPPWIWNLTPSGSVVKSFDLSSWPYPNMTCLAYDADTAGGPFLFVGVYSAPPYIIVTNPNSDDPAIIRSFRAPTSDYSVSDLSWDGHYLWVLDNGPWSPTVCWVYRVVAHEYQDITPASLGKIKALFR